MSSSNAPPREFGIGALCARGVFSGGNGRSEVRGGAWGASPSPRSQPFPIQSTGNTDTLYWMWNSWSLSHNVLIREVRVTASSNMWRREQTETLYFGSDRNREPWVILSVMTLEEKVVGWRTAYANPMRIVRNASASEGDERAALERLMDEIEKCKRSTILVTFSRATLALLRRRILHHRIKTSFRGLRYICLENLLSEYLGEEGIPDDIAEDSRAMWRLLTGVGPLVPARTLEGERL